MPIRLSHKQNDFIDPDGDQYKVLQVIKSGGMGTVYKVLKLSTQTVYAVKECDILDDPRGKGISRKDALDSFYQEGRHSESIDCDGIPKGFLQEFRQKDMQVCLQCGNKLVPSDHTCQICNVDTDNIYYHPQTVDKRVYLFMDYIDGMDLDEILDQYQRPYDAGMVAEIFKWIHAAGKIIAFLHERGFIHRDIKPENIRIRKSDGKVFLLDFGLIRDMSSGRSQAAAKTANMGTPGYSPPEQAIGNPSKASDIYALNMTLVHALTGLAPDIPDENDQILNTPIEQLLPFLAPTAAGTISASLKYNIWERPEINDWLTHTHDPFERAAPSKKTRSKPKTKRHAATLSKSLLYAAIAVMLLLIAASVIYFNLPESGETLTATGRPGGIIYEQMDKNAILMRMKGREKLLVKDVSTDNNEYWLKILKINGQTAKGYVLRKDINVYGT